MYFSARFSFELQQQAPQVWQSNSTLVNLAPKARPAARRAGHFSRRVRLTNFRSIRRFYMLWTITVILLVLWVLGLVSGSAMGAWVHILLVLAIVSLIFAVMRRGAGAVP
jgi:Family of unknown function (DUF5670)